MLSSTEANAHPQSARSIGTYLNQVTPSEDDKAWIAKITEPNGWRQEFNDPDSLEPDELIERSKILDRLKKFPPIKVFKVFDFHLIISI